MRGWWREGRDPYVLHAVVVRLLTTRPCDGGGGGGGVVHGRFGIFL